MEQNEQQLMKLEGTVEHVIYENADTGYAVFEVDANGTDVVVAGNVGGVDNGMSVTVYGHMVNHPSYGVFKCLAASLKLCVSAICLKYSNCLSSIIHLHFLKASKTYVTLYYNEGITNAI